ncbi:phage tail protein [Escherichia coli]|nr:phage tail protein [Escherichia coli]
MTHMAVGDGGGIAAHTDSKQTRLAHEVWRHTVNRVILGRNTSESHYCGAGYSSRNGRDSGSGKLACLMSTAI